MKRNLIFSAALLSCLEDSLDPLGVDDYALVRYLADQFGVSDDESEQAVLQDSLGYHLEILEGAGLISAGTQEGDDSLYYNLTWAGHDYLDAYRADGYLERMGSL